MFLRPDQRVAIVQRGDNMSEVVRQAIDMYLSIHPVDSDVNYGEALAAMAADDSE